MRKAQILHDQAVLSLFTMPNEDSLSELALEYVNLRHEEEMSKLRWRLIEEKEVATSAAVEAKGLAVERDAEVEVATRNHIPPPPQQPRPAPTAAVPTSPTSPELNSSTASPSTVSQGKFVFFFLHLLAGSSSCVHELHFIFLQVRLKWMQLMCT
jgi:hypothetical protein